MANTFDALHWNQRRFFNQITIWLVKDHALKDKKYKERNLEEQNFEEQV